MEKSWFSIVGVAGIGGVALAAVVYVFREIIRKEIFPRLTKGQAYSLLNKIIVMIFVMGVLGIGAYLLTSLINPRVESTNDQNNNTSIPTPRSLSELNGGQNSKTPSSPPIVNNNSIQNAAPTVSPTAAVTNSPPVPSPTPYMTHLSGTIFDDNGNRLQGARVSIDELPDLPAVEAATNGVFNFMKIPLKAGEHIRIRVHKDGYHPDEYTEDIILGTDSPRIRLVKNK